MDDKGRPCPKELCQQRPHLFHKANGFMGFQEGSGEGEGFFGGFPWVKCVPCFFQTFSPPHRRSE